MRKTRKQVKSISFTQAEKKIFGWHTAIRSNSIFHYPQTSSGNNVFIVL